jgi:hypothetical protein
LRRLPPLLRVLSFPVPGVANIFSKLGLALPYAGHRRVLAVFRYLES